MEDLNATSLEAAVEMIKGSCRAMGVTVAEQHNQITINVEAKFALLPQKEKKCQNKLKNKRKQLK